MSKLVALSRALARRAGGLSFAPPTAYVYNPLVYARAPHEAYLRAYGDGASAGGAGRAGAAPVTPWPRGRVLLLGMNPGPFGMAQTGVPFGDVRMVRDYLGISGAVARPPREHPARPVMGFDCPRGEVSGARLWGWARARFGAAPRAFFERFFVFNYCPLAFMETGGRNRTPDKLPAAEQGPLFAACDRALGELVEVLAPSLVVGVGAFATDRAKGAVSSRVKVGTILHPSPANPRANAGWAGIIEGQLQALGVDL